MDASLVADVEAFLQNLTRRRGQSKEEFVLVALADGSVRLLISVPAGAATPEDLAELECLAVTEREIESIAAFDSLDASSQQTWRTAAHNHPPVIRDNALRPTVSWSEMTDIAHGMSPTVRSKLIHILTRRFSVEELRMLCDIIGEPYESLPGTSKADRIRELVGHYEGRNELRTLIETANQRIGTEKLPETSSQN